MVPSLELNSSLVQVLVEKYNSFTMNVDYVATCVLDRVDAVNKQMVSAVIGAYQLTFTR
jgi:hypothetical protein